MTVTIIGILAAAALICGIVAAMGKPAIIGWVGVILLAIAELVRVIPTGG